jgi:Fe-S cluster biogenesis protein NfuA
VTDSPITAEPSPTDPLLCRFTAERPFHDASFLCVSAAAAEGSPLLEKLFAAGGVRQALVEGRSVLVQKDPVEDWASLAPRVGAVLRDALRSGGPLFSGADAGPRRVERLRKAVQAALDREVNPGLSSHGGKAEIASLEGTVLSLRLSGGCQGCSSAKITLGQGIERVLRQRVPELTAIRDVTDHAGGAAPYFRAGSAGPSPMA